MSVDLPEGNYPARGSLGPTAERMAATIRACWFQSGDPAFEGYRQESEITSLSGQPRILIVRENERGGLPQLAVTIRTISGAGTVVSAFGPLTETPLRARINADIERWASGSRQCATAS
ncbi:MAG: hypothetical protein KI785_00640 [Devosiaceae bacterium]|nr:hypothetical protein [Devosiaceae bacterium MH13]